MSGVGLIFMRMDTHHSYYESWDGICHASGGGVVLTMCLGVWLVFTVFGGVACIHCVWGCGLYSLCFGVCGLYSPCLGGGFFHHVWGCGLYSPCLGAWFVRLGRSCTQHVLVGMVCIHHVWEGGGVACFHHVWGCGACTHHVWGHGLYV